VYGDAPPDIGNIALKFHHAWVQHVYTVHDRVTCARQRQNPRRDSLHRQKAYAIVPVILSLSSTSQAIPAVAIQEPSTLLNAAPMLPRPHPAGAGPHLSFAACARSAFDRRVYESGPSFYCNALFEGRSTMTTSGGHRTSSSSAGPSVRARNRIAASRPFAQSSRLVRLSFSTSSWPLSGSETIAIPRPPSGRPSHNILPARLWLGLGPPIRCSITTGVRTPVAPIGPEYETHHQRSLRAEPCSLTDRRAAAMAGSRPTYSCPATSRCILTSGGRADRVRIPTRPPRGTRLSSRASQTRRRAVGLSGLFPTARPAMSATFRRAANREHLVPRWPSNIEELQQFGRLQPHLLT